MLVLLRAESIRRAFVRSCVMSDDRKQTSMQRGFVTLWLPGGLQSKFEGPGFYAKKVFRTIQFMSHLTSRFHTFLWPAAWLTIF